MSPHLLPAPTPATTPSLGGGEARDPLCGSRTSASTLEPARVGDAGNLAGRLLPAHAPRPLPAHAPRALPAARTVLPRAPSRTAFQPRPWLREPEPPGPAVATHRSGTCYMCARRGRQGPVRAEERAPPGWLAGSALTGPGT